MIVVGSLLSAVQDDQKMHDTRRTTVSLTTMRPLMQIMVEVNNGVEDTILMTALGQKVKPMLPLKRCICEALLAVVLR